MSLIRDRLHEDVTGRGTFMAVVIVFSPTPHDRRRIPCWPAPEPGKAHVLEIGPGDWGLLSHQIGSRTRSDLP